MDGTWFEKFQEIIKRLIFMQEHIQNTILLIQINACVVSSFLGSLQTGRQQALPDLLRSAG